MSHKSFFTICIYTKETTVRHSNGMHRHLRRLMKGLAARKSCLTRFLLKQNEEHRHTLGKYRKTFSWTFWQQENSVGRLCHQFCEHCPRHTDCRCNGVATQGVYWRNPGTYCCLVAIGNHQLRILLFQKDSPHKSQVLHTFPCNGTCPNLHVNLPSRGHITAIPIPRVQPCSWVRGHCLFRRWRSVCIIQRHYVAFETQVKKETFQYIPKTTWKTRKTCALLDCLKVAAQVWRTPKRKNSVTCWFHYALRWLWRRERGAFTAEVTKALRGYNRFRKSDGQTRARPRHVMAKKRAWRNAIGCSHFFSSPYTKKGSHCWLPFSLRRERGFIPLYHLL